MSGSVNASFTNENLIYTSSDATEAGRQRAAQESLRAAVTFGTRKLSYSLIDQQAPGAAHQILHARNRTPLTEVRVSFENSIRQGLLPLSPHRANETSGVNKYAIGRFIHRIVAWVAGRLGRAALTVDGPYAKTLSEARRPQIPQNGGCGNVRMSPRDDERKVIAPDKELARLLGYGLGDRHGTAFAVVEQESKRGNRTSDTLFGDRAPQLSDIRQSDRRSTCYFLSNLAAILSRPDGAQRIQDIMKDNGDGTVTVRFVDKDVVVSKDRIVNNEGRDIFSSGAPWVRIMEKAFLAYQAVKHLNDRNPADEVASPCLSDVNAQEFQNDFLNRFDTNTPILAQRALAHTLGCRTVDCSQLDEAGLANPTFERLPIAANSRPDEAFHQIQQTLENGGTVYTAVAKMGKWFKRVLPGHVYCILSVGTSRKPGRSGQAVAEQGYWVFDPYGKSVGSAVFS